MTAKLSESPATPGEREDRPGRTGDLTPAVLTFVATNLVAFDVRVPVLRVVAGLFVLIILPAYLVYSKSRWSRRHPTEAIIYSVAAVLLCVIAGGLLMNEILPLIGVARPLDRLPVLVAADLSLLGLLWWRHRDWPDTAALPATVVAVLRNLTSRERLLLVAGLLVVFAAVAGAVRLNNGAGGTAAVVMLCLAALLVAGLIRWRWQLRPGVVAVTIYLFALALLLMTSLRGWDIAGHDIQREFHVFQLTAANGNWSVSRFRDAYNACLSITIFPTILTGMTGLSGAYVFKIVFQLIFALCPVIVYLIARRFASALVAVLAAVYFTSFPTFFTDMPFLTRQEIAFVFLGTLILIATNGRYSVRHRQAGVALCSVGVVLSHYSTTYMLIALLVLAGLARGIVSVGERFLATRRSRRPTSGRAVVLGLANIAFLVLLTALWTGPATDTGGQLGQTTTRILMATFGGTDAGQSSDVSYGLFSSLFSSGGLSPEQRLQRYTDDTIADTAKGRSDGTYYPLSVVGQYPVPLVEPENLPLTAVGRALNQTGLDVPLLNGLMRKGAAGLLQIFVALGVVFVALRRARGIRVSREMFFLAIASAGTVASQVVLPAVSADYGLLRAFQQSLFVLAPFVAVGSIHVFAWLTVRRAALAASAVAVTFFLSLTGVIPEILGGYPAQLHLNNSGSYYDEYYRHPEELAAVDWLQDQVVPVGKGGIQTAVPTDRYTFELRRRYPDIHLDDAIYPTQLRVGTYVLLGTTVLGKDQSTIVYNGDVLTYRYPLPLLDRTKDLVYHSGGAAIYR